MVARIQIVWTTSWQLPCFQHMVWWLRNISFILILFWLKFQKLEEGSFFFHRFHPCINRSVIEDQSNSILYSCCYQYSVLWALPLWGLKTGTEAEATRNLLVFFSLPLKHTAILFNVEFSPMNLTSPWSAGRLQRLLALTLIYPVCGNVHFLDPSNIVQNFKSSKWIQKFIVFWKTNLNKSTEIFICLGYPSAPWQQFHLRRKKGI